MKIIDIIKIIDGYFLNMPIELKVNKFSTNSKEIKPGDCFIAINSGFDYIEESINKGAVLIITDRTYHYKGNVGIIKVKNSIIALSKIAQYIRQKYIKIPLIGITGSCGKTTLKELIYNILKTKYKVLKTDKNYNNIIGISNTLLNLDNSYDIIICEMGINNKGEIKNLCDICKPDIGIITNINSSHIGNFKTKKEIFNEKKILLDYSNKIIVNKNDRYLKKYDNQDIIKYSKIKYVDDKLTFKYNNKYNIKFNIPNKKMLDLITLAINTSQYFKIDIDTIIKQINLFEPIEGRMKIYKKNYTVIDDCYNASFESFNFDYIKNLDNLIIIIGDILELGKYSEIYHKKLNFKLKKIKSIKLLVGNYTKLIDGKHFDNNNEIIDYLSNLDLTNKYIYIKGSHNNNLKEIVDYLIKDF